MDTTNGFRRGGPRVRHGAFTGKARPRLYYVWRNMRQRCHNPKDRDYPRYGGRGITVCARWFSDFGAFRADMGEPSDPSLTLDRIDNDGPYEPGNVRWATRKEQNRNMRSTRWVTFRGERLCVQDVARLTGLSHSGINYRLAAGKPLDVPSQRPRH